jgi:hypothetical protein
LRQLPAAELARRGRFQDFAVDCGQRVWRWLGIDGGVGSPIDQAGIERPWLLAWHAVPKRSAGPGFGPSDYARARERAEAVAALTFGEQNWESLQRQGYLDLRSSLFAGLRYRLRIGRRVELIWDSPEAALASPWPFDWLCINPTYPLPAAEFTAHLYLYLRDREREVLRIAAPQPFDQALGRCF